MSERVVEFGDTRYEFVDGHWWPDVTPQERVLVEELERQQAGIRSGAAERDRLRAELEVRESDLYDVVAALKSCRRERDEVQAELDEVQAELGELVRRLRNIDLLGLNAWLEEHDR
jgi:septal ring factor EnvC (AmiA/AmiB activator)